MVKILIFIYILIFIGCGSGGTTATNSTNIKSNTIETDSNTSIILNEPYYYQQWYLDINKTFYKKNDIDSNASIHLGDYKNRYRGNGVKIAIIDDGLDVNHEDLKGAIVDTYNVADGSKNVEHTNYYGFHGTAVTGIIGARYNHKGILGIANKSQIMFLKYKDNMSDSETIELFNKAKDWGADIINCSWGTGDVSDAVKGVIQDLATNGRRGKGIVIVFAVGNNDQDMGNDESAIPEVIAVGSTNKDNLRTWYSNYGKNLDIVAPGGYDVGITTLDDMGDRGVGTLNDDYILANDDNRFIGTSASAPIVTGVIALMLEKDPNLTRKDIENILHITSDKIGNLKYTDGFNQYYGYGKIDVGKIMRYLTTKMQ